MGAYMTVDIATLAIRVESLEATNATRELERLRDTGGEAGQSVTRLDDVTRKAAAGLKMLAAALATNELVKQADLWASLEGRINQVTNSERQLAAVRRELFDISHLTRAELEGTVDLYTKLTRSTQGLNTTEAQRLRVTESINKLMVVSSAVSEEAAGAIRQLGQAMGSGVLRGDELNRILESAPRLAEAIAEGMGRSALEVRALAEQGKITSKALVDALLTQSETIDAEFSKMPKTVGQSMTQVENAVLRSIGVFDQQNQLSGDLASSMSYLAENMGSVAAAGAVLAGSGALVWFVNMTKAVHAKVAAVMAEIAVQRAAAAARVTATTAAVAETGAQVAATQARLAEVRAAALAAIGHTQLAIVTNGLIPAQARAAAASAAHTAALTAQTAATTAAAGVAGLASRALALVGGPLGAITLLLTAGAAAWAWWANRAEKAETQVAATSAEKTAEIIADLNKQIKKFEERDRLMKASPDVAKTGGPGADRLGEILTDIERVSKDGSLSLSVKQELLKNLGAEYNTLTVTMEKHAAAQAKVDATVKADKHAEWLNKNTQYMTEAEKQAKAYKDAEAELGRTLTANDKARIDAALGKKAAAKAGKDAAQVLKEESDLIAELAGLTSSFSEDWDRLSGLYGKGKITLDQLTGAQAKLLAQQPAMVESLEKETKAREAAEAAQKAAYAEPNKIWDQVRALQAEIVAYGQTAEAAEQAAVTKVQAQLLSAELSEDETRALEMKLVALRALAVEQGKIAALDTGSDVTKAKELLEILTAVDQATKSAADGMAASFGHVGSAIGGLTTALSGYAVQQQAIMAQLAAAKADPKNGPDKIAKMEIAAANASAQAKIKSYGDMAGAAKGFFKENTKGYKVMEGAEKAFRAYEMAMAVQTMLTKSGLLTAFTGLFGASKAAEVSATVATVPATVAAEGVKQKALATTAMTGAVAVPFPGNIAAFGIVAAMLAAIGLGGFGGGGNVDIAKDRQAAAGTGSVLGDSSAKSESIARSVELAANNSSTELNYTAAMLRSLLAIQSSLSGLGNLLIRSGDVGGALPADTVGSMGKLGSAIGSPLKGMPGGELLGNAYAKLTNAIFGGNVTTLDGGITAGKTTVGGALAGGLTASRYVDTKKDGGWFRSDKYNTQLTALSPETNGQLSKVIADMAAGVKEAGKLLGFEGDDFNRKLSAFTIDLGKISTKGLKPEEIQKQLEAVFSKVGDDMARYAVNGLAPFQKVGEGYLETLVRVASNYANLDAVLHSVGMTFGAVGLSSIAAREDFIAMAGGMDELAGKYSSFADNFLTEAQRLAPVQKYVTDQLAALGLSHLKSRDAFADHLLALDPAVEAERKQIAALLDLEGAFAKVYAQTKDLTKSQQAIADERADLQNQLDELTMSSIQLLNKQRMALDASNRGLFDQIQAAKAAKDAQDAAKSSLGDMIGTLKSFGDSARALSSSMVTGSLSTLTPEQQYAELERQYQTTRMAGIAGDTKAQSNFASIAQAFLTASQKINGGDARYSSDFAGVLRDSEEIAKWTTAQVDVAQASLDAMNAQVVGIGTLNDTMLAAVQGIEALPAAIAGPNYAAMGSPDKDALVAEIKSLKDALVAEIKGRREDAKRQTGDTIGGIASAVAKGAEKVADGIDDANTNTRSRNYKVPVDDF